MRVLDRDAFYAKILSEQQRLAGVAKNHSALQLDGLSKPQLSFVLDNAQRQIAVTGRQSGKTESCARKLIRCALDNPGSVQLYIGPTRQNARDVMWQRLQDRLMAAEISFKPNISRLEIVVNNNSVIRLFGVNHKDLADRQRGNIYDQVIIDESAVYGSLLSYLVNDVIEQTLLAKRGKLVLISTPGLLQSGWFYDVCHGSGTWSRHKWTVRDNPALVDIDEYLRTKLADNRWSESEPTFRREYLGEWCEDTRAGVYRISRANVIDAIPDAGFHSILGVDLGYNDEAAFCVLSWRDYDPVLYVRYADGKSGMDVTDIAEYMRKIVDEYRPQEIVADAGALGKTIVSELTLRHGLNITAANKRDKPAAIRLVNADLQKRRLMMTDGRLYEQMSNLRWHPDYIGLKEQDGIPNDLCDAMLYAFKSCWHYVQREREAVPEANSEAWIKAQAEEYRNRTLLNVSSRDEWQQLGWEKIDVQ